MMSDNLTEQEKKRLAEAVREACLRAAVDGYERASWDGLCHEGAWEVALSAIQGLNVAEIIQKVSREPR